MVDFSSLGVAATETITRFHNMQKTQKLPTQGNSIQLSSMVQIITSLNVPLSPPWQKLRSGSLAIESLTPSKIIKASLSWPLESSPSSLSSSCSILQAMPSSLRTLVHQAELQKLPMIRETLTQKIVEVMRKTLQIVLKAMPPTLQTLAQQTKPHKIPTLGCRILIDPSPVKMFLSGRWPFLLMSCSFHL